MATYKVYLVDDQGEQTEVGDTTVNVGSIGILYDLLESKATATLDKYVDTQDITSEDRAAMIANTIVAAITQSVTGVQKQEILDTQVALNNEQLDLNTQSKTHKVTSLEKDNQIKDLRKIALEKQNAGIDAETALKVEQKTQLIQSMTDNKLIKAINAVGSTFGTAMAGGIVVPDAGWNGYFGMVNSLTGENIDGSGFQAATTSI